MLRVLSGVAVAASLLLPPLAALTPDVLRPVRAVPPHVAGRFRDVRAFQQAPAGHHYVFDRRAHRVFAIDEQFESAWQIVQIGAEPGRIIGPTAFSTAPDGTVRRGRRAGGHAREFRSSTRPGSGKPASRCPTDRARAGRVR